VLEGQARGDSSNGRVRLNIEVVSRSLSDEPLRDVVGSLEIVTTEPATQNGSVNITSDAPIVTLVPVPGFPNPIVADLDTNIDTDADGNPANDNDLADTLFATEHNALHIWYATPNTAAPIHFSTQAADGTVLEQDLGISGGPAAVPSGNISVGTERNGTVEFTFALPFGIDPSTIVYQ
jgi:hypothetical protein